MKTNNSRNALSGTCQVGSGSESIHTEASFWIRLFFHMLSTTPHRHHQVSHMHQEQDSSKYSRVYGHLIQGLLRSSNTCVAQPFEMPKPPLPPPFFLLQKSLISSSQSRPFRHSHLFAQPFTRGRKSLTVLKAAPVFIRFKRSAALPSSA